nr:hypothetical protein GCM10020092_026510 [Actinoplanes digitatis]
MVKLGRTRPSVAIVATAASAPPVPSGLKTAKRRRTAPTSRDRPRMPLQVIITAAKTVSRASACDFSGPVIIRVTIRATSMTVTATARTSEPKGSPTLCATTSAWCTAASTALTSSVPLMITSGAGSSRPQVRMSATTASTGIHAVHRAR